MELRYLTKSEWVSFEDAVPGNNGRMIWWDDGEKLAPYLVPASDFCSEDKGYWAEVSRPARAPWPLEST